MESLQKVFDGMLKRGIDVSVLTNGSNVKYVSGLDVPYWASWMEDVSNGLPMVTAVLCAKQRKMRLVASDLYKSRIIRTGITDAEIFRSFTHLEKNDADQNFRESFQHVLRDLCEGKQKPVIGIEPNETTYYMLQLIKEIFPGCSWDNASQVVADSRYIKTSEDIQGLKEAARVADAAQGKLYEIAQNEGKYSELDIWFEVQKAASKSAGCLVPFVGELVSGAKTGLSDYPLGPTERIVEKGDIAIMDISPRVNGYWGDCSNSVVFWKEPNDEQKKYFYAVKDAFDAGFQAIHPGARFNEVNSIMEEQYKKHGLNFCSYQGHQIGCSVNEKPRFTYVDETIIEENMVLCIEPQMYTGKTGKTGVRLERALLVTKDGAVALNKFQWGMK